MTSKNWFRFWASPLCGCCCQATPQNAVKTSTFVSSGPPRSGPRPGRLLQLIDRRREFLADPEERDHLGGDLDRRLLLRVPSDPRPPVPDAEAPKSPELDLVAFGERLRDPVEDGVDDGLGFLLGEARQP